LGSSHLALMRGTYMSELVEPTVRMANVPVVSESGTGAGWELWLFRSLGILWCRNSWPERSTHYSPSSCQPSGSSFLGRCIRCSILGHARDVHQL